MSRFIIAEPSQCIGCRTCEVACALAHLEGDAAEPLSPANFRPRLHLVKNQSISAPVQCRHCMNAPCITVCPTNAIVYSEDTVQIIEERCIGCQSCVVACPFGAMSMATKAAQTLSVSPHLPGAQPLTSHAHKCDLCIDRESGPACIRVCPTNALHLIQDR